MTTNRYWTIIVVETLAAILVPIFAPSLAILTLGIVLVSAPLLASYVKGFSLEFTMTMVFASAALTAMIVYPSVDISLAAWYERLPRYLPLALITIISHLLTMRRLNGIYSYGEFSPLRALRSEGLIFLFISIYMVAIAALIWILGPYANWLIYLLASLIIAMAILTVVKGRSNSLPRSEGEE